MDQQRRWDDALGNALLPPEKLERRLDDALASAKQGGRPLAVLCAYRADLKLSPQPATLIAHSVAIVMHNLTRPTDFTGLFEGNTIVCVLPDTDAAAAWVVTERLSAEFRGREDTKRWRVTPITHAEQFGSGQRLLHAVHRLTSELAA